MAGSNVVSDAALLHPQFSRLVDQLEGLVLDQDSRLYRDAKETKARAGRDAGVRRREALRAHFLCQAAREVIRGDPAFKPLHNKYLTLMANMDGDDDGMKPANGHDEKRKDQAPVLMGKVEETMRGWCKRTISFYGRSGLVLKQLMALPEVAQEQVETLESLRRSLDEETARQGALLMSVGNAAGDMVTLLVSGELAQSLSTAQECAQLATAEMEARSGLMEYKCRNYNMKVFECLYQRNKVYNAIAQVYAGLKKRIKEKQKREAELREKLEAYQALGKEMTAIAKEYAKVKERIRKTQAAILHVEQPAAAKD